MNSVARSLALRALHRREVRGRLQRPAAAVGNGNKKAAAAAAAAAAYSTAERLAAYRCRSDGGYLLLPLVAAVGAGTWLIATAATRYVMTRPRQGTTTKTTATVVDGPRPEVVAASSAPSNQ